MEQLPEEETVNSLQTDEDSERVSFRRDENGILWCYDSDGNKVGRIFEHGIE